MNSAGAVVIAHFHPEGHVSIDMVNLIKHLFQLSGRIVFVSTGINDSAVETIEPYAKVIRRENVGYDFWSYKVGVEALGDLGELDRLVFLNSSFITIDPESLMSNFFTPVGEPLVKGLTISTERSVHIQSYLFSFETRDLINSSAFKEWWETMQPISKKTDVISQYEIGMSSFFSQRGYALKAVYEPSNQDLFVATGRLIAAGGLVLKDTSKSIVNIDINAARELNPTHYLWDILYERFKIFKKELLKENPTEQNIGWINSLEPEVQQLIRDALK